MKDGARFLAQKPPTWDDEQLRADAVQSEKIFIMERQSEGHHAYKALFSESEPLVRRLFDVTDDLHALTGSVLNENLELLGLIRHLTGPPISADDLRTLVGDPLGKQQLDDDVADMVAKSIFLELDPVRFPWLSEKRQPTEAERDAAVRWTTGLYAAERIRTFRRNDAKKVQEDAVAQALSSVGFVQCLPRDVGPINVVDRLERGQFTRETKVAGQKADMPTRLHDGRLLAIECKVSNSAVNSVKRLINDVGSKGSHWRDEFGAQVIPAAVLAGVFKVTNLRRAQADYGVTIFWGHNLAPLKEFVQQAV